MTTLTTDFCRDCKPATRTPWGGESYEAVTLCPLHQNAPALLSALQNLIEENSYHADNCIDSTCSLCLAIDKAFVAISSAQGA